jgi:glycerol-3-phosphate cytidylyltransferase
MDVMDVRTKEITHPAVDILPLDGAPNNIILRKLYFFEIMSIRALSSMSNRDIIDHSRKRNVFEKVLISIVMKIPFEKILNDRKLKYYLEKRMKSYSVKESRYIGCLMGAYRTKQMVPKDWFGNGEGYVFEDLLVNGPVDYSNYLKQMYGDYMKMPDDETIKSKIHYKIVEKMKNKIGFTAGTFDMFHIGHLNLLKEAKKNCQYLIVGVNKDNLVSTYKKKLPLIPEDERAEIINALAYVDEVYLMDTLDKMEAFKRFHFDVIFIGSDWQGSERYKMEEKRMEDVGVAITYIPYTSEISSTMLAHRILENELTRTSFQRKIKELNK